MANLKGFRKSRNISQEKLAEICDTEINYIAEFEGGKKFPSLEMIEKIAAALDIESYYLFQNNDSTDIKNSTPLQKQEIIDMLYKAASEINDFY